MKTLFLLMASSGEPAPLVDIDKTIFLQLGIFLVLLFFLTKLVFRPYLALLRERDESIDGAKEKAHRLDARAETDLSSYEDQIIKARKEAASVRMDKRGEGEEEASKVLAKARDEADQKIQAARQKIEKSSQAAQLALRTRADEIARDVATKLLGREV